MKITILCGTLVLLTASSLFAGSIVYRTNAYTARVFHDGSTDRLNFPPSSPDHISTAEYTAYYNSGINYFSGFNILNNVSLSNNVLTSRIGNDELEVAFTTVFMPSNWFEQRMVVQNTTNYPLSTLVLYRVQDGDLFGDGANNMVGRDAATRAVFQSEFGLHIAQNLFLPNLGSASSFQGGDVGVVYNNMDLNALDGSLVQTNDTAVAQGIALGTFPPGAITTVVCRVSFGASRDEAMANALPVTFNPGVTKLAFSIDMTKVGNDALGFTATFDPTLIGLTSLVNRTATLYVNDCAVLDGVSGVVKSSSSGDSATYATTTAKAVLSIKPSKHIAAMKVTMKKADVRGIAGTAVMQNGTNGVLNPVSVRFALDTTNVSGRASVIVPYKAKINKGFSGKQW